jgi:hypothetical protein
MSEILRALGRCISLEAIFLVSNVQENPSALAKTHRSALQEKYHVRNLASSYEGKIRMAWSLSAA